MLPATPAFLPCTCQLTKFRSKCLVNGLMHIAGPDSGASQPHKHLQVIPLPLMAGQPTVLPMEALLNDATAPAAAGEVISLHQLPYCSFAARIDEDRYSLVCCFAGDTDARFAHIESLPCIGQNPDASQTTLWRSAQSSNCCCCAVQDIRRAIS